MKKILVILLGMLSMTAVAQNKMAYCKIVATSKLFSTKVNIKVDFGQGRDYWDYTKDYLVDENGKAIIFNSVVDALNYMGTFGWELVTTCAIGDSQNGFVYHFLMCKKINSDETIENGFKTQKQYETNQENVNTPPEVKQKITNDTIVVVQNKNELKQEPDSCDKYDVYEWY